MHKKILIKLSMILMLLSVINGCSQPIHKQCSYQDIVAIDKVERVKIHFNDDGSLDSSNSQKLAKNTIALRISEDYYYNAIIDYNKLIKELKAKN